MTSAIPTYVHCTDPISLAGVISQLRTRPEVRVVEELDVDQAAVAVVVADQLDDDTSRVVRALCRGDQPRIVLVATVIDESTLVAAAEVGVGGLLPPVRRDSRCPGPRDHAAWRWARARSRPTCWGVCSSRWGGSNVRCSPRADSRSAACRPRETEVLRLVAEGHDTSEIASRMCYSERTVKNVLHDLTTRLQLKNRTHAVAYAMREGLI